MANIQAVVFDLYGTLIYLANETKPHVRLFSELGLQKDEFRFARRIALTENFDDFSGFLNRLKPEGLEKKIDISSYEIEIEKERASATLYPETKNVLAGLKEKNLKIGLISNLGSLYKKPFFDLQLDEYFDEILFSCDVGLRKPDPKIYQRMIEKLKIEPNRAIMTGDKIHADVDGPKSIGMNAVHLNRKNISSESIFTLEGIFQYLFVSS
jgi:HAD superfamily hydrolase (TIGR01549 family)